MLSGIPDDSYKGLGCKRSSGQNKIQFLPPDDMGCKIDNDSHIYVYISHSVMFSSMPPNVLQYGCHRYMYMYRYTGQSNELFATHTNTADFLIGLLYSTVLLTKIGHKADFTTPINRSSLCKSL